MRAVWTATIRRLGLVRKEGAVAYTKSWDESAPIGATTPAADLDVIIQDLKIALRERLEQVIPDFGNDGVDPKVIPLANIEGTEAYCAFFVAGATLSGSPAIFSGLTIQSQVGGYTLEAGGTGIEVPNDGTYSLNGSLVVTAPPGAIVLIDVSSTGGTYYGSTAVLAPSASLAGNVQVAVAITAVFVGLTAGDVIQVSGYNSGSGTASHNGSNLIVRQIA